jgi:predicted transcriptional regulator
VDDQTISLTAQIVSAHIANNNVAAQELPTLIRDVYQTLATVGQVPAEPIKAEPAVAVKKSVFADHILCLDCGGRFKTLKGHIRANHQMTLEEYRAKWGLPTSYPMVAADYAATRSKLAFANRLGQKKAPTTTKKGGRPKNGLVRICCSVAERLAHALVFALATTGLPSGGSGQYQSDGGVRCTRKPSGLRQAVGH